MMAHFRRTTEQSFARPFASREQLKTFLNNGGDPNIPDLVCYFLFLFFCLLLLLTQNIFK